MAFQVVMREVLPPIPRLVLPELNQDLGSSGNPLPALSSDHFEFGRYLRPETQGAREFREAMDKGFAADMGNLMVKRGVIGNHRVCVASSASDHDLACSVFYVDNGMHSGASGGPVVNSDGEAIGLITQRAMTDAAQSSHPEPLFIPSGSTLCLGLEPVKWLFVKSHATKE